jgi:DNA-binding winged helix-turn-helix (wHTH) protein
MATSAQNRRTLRFNGFEVDPRSREVRRNGSRVRLQDQPLEVLLLLVERRGEVVSREELKDRLWPAGTFVDSDDGLNTAIKKLREVLRDSSERPRYIETIPRRGYRFIGELEVEESEVPELRLKTFESPVPPAEAAPIGDAETKSSRNGGASETDAYSQQPITDATGVSPRPRKRWAELEHPLGGGCLAPLFSLLALPRQSGICAVHCLHRAYRTLSKSPTMATRKTSGEQTAAGSISISGFRVSKPFCRLE